MKAVPIKSFPAEVPYKDEKGNESWQACEVVAVTVEFTGHGQFIVIAADDNGVLWTHAVESVRRNAA